MTAARKRAKAAPARRVPAAFDPPRLEQSQAALASALSRSRLPYPLTIEDATFELTFALAPPAELDARSLNAAFTIGGEPARLRLCAHLVESLTGLLAPGVPADALDDELKLLLIDLGLTTCLQRLEQRLGARISPLRLAAAETSPAGDIAIRIGCGNKIGIAGFALLALPGPLTESVVRLLDEIPAARPANPSLPIPVAFRVALVGLTVAELADLNAGDVVICDRNLPGLDDVVAVLGERWLYAAKAAAGTVTLATPRHDARVSLEYWTMDDADKKPLSEPASADAELAEIPIKLFFEIGRLEIPLGEVQRLGPGYVFELGRPVSEPVDILANGRRIGQGEIVRIGDATGVRVTRLLGHG